MSPKITKHNRFINHTTALNIIKDDTYLINIVIKLTFRPRNLSSFVNNK